MSRLVNDGMDEGSIMESEDRIEKTVDIYISAEAVRDMKLKKDTEDFDTQTVKTQTPQHTGSDSVRIRSSRAAAVCLGLLCVLLLTAVIVLCVMFTQERQQFISKNENLTNKRDQLRSSLNICDGWTYYQSSFYYISKENKSWTESKRYCTERGADLIIINNREEQNFVKNLSSAAVVWIGLTDTDVEGRWKWVDGTNMTSGFWASGEPGGGTSENCTVTVPVSTPQWSYSGWHDVACNRALQWICEKSISQLILP